MGNGRRAAAGPELMRYVPNDAHQSAIWPSLCDVDGYAQLCPALSLILPH